MAVSAARPGVQVRPGVRIGVRVAPWVINYRPAPRAGFIWIDGGWRGSVYVAGHWRPDTPPPRSDYVWVDGHWEDETYVDGYWRIQEIDGILWVDSGYDEDEYVEGRWEDPAGYAVPQQALPEAAAVPIEPDGALAVPFGVDPEPEPQTPLHHAPPDRW
jgi:hypothetical protein